MPSLLAFRPGILADYADVYTPEALRALEALAPLNDDRRGRMAARTARRQARAAQGEPIGFLDPGTLIPRTRLTVADARAGRFDGAEIPPDLQRQWIQGTGPGTRPRSGLKSGLRNVAYALLSGADGWMFDGEDALGQVDTMSLDNQRNLKLALARDPVFLEVAQEVAGEMNQWAEGFFGRPIVADWRAQLGLHHRALPLPRPAPRRPPRPGAGRRGLLGLDRRPGAVRGQQPCGPARRGAQHRALPAEDPDRRGGRPLERPPRRPRSAPRPAGGHHQGLRAGRAARGSASS